MSERWGITIVDDIKVYQSEHTFEILSFHRFVSLVDVFNEIDICLLCLLLNALVDDFFLLDLTQEEEVNLCEYFANFGRIPRGEAQRQVTEQNLNSSLSASYNFAS